MNMVEANLKLGESVGFRNNRKLLSFDRLLFTLLGFHPETDVFLHR